MREGAGGAGRGIAELRRSAFSYQTIEQAFCNVPYTSLQDKAPQRLDCWVDFPLDARADEATVGLGIARRRAAAIELISFAMSATAAFRCRTENGPF